MSGGLVVLNPGGRDAPQSFAAGAGTPRDPGHPPVNYHGYAACMHGHFLRDVRAIPSGTRAAIVLLRKRNLRVVLKALAILKGRGIRTWISFKESGAHQVAEFLSDYNRSLLFRRICASADGYLSSTPDLEPLYRTAGCRDGFFAPTPYPVEEPAWDRGIPLADRKGIFVGTREFDVPSRNHWQAVAMAAALGRELEVPVAVMSNAGRHGLRLLKAIRGDNPFLHFLVGPFAYPDYLRVVAAHRIVFQLDASAVPGQVAGDALLCRMPCVGGNGAVDRATFGGLAGGDVRDLAKRLMIDDEAWRAAVEDSQRAARERLSFSAVRDLLAARMDASP
ncbi:MAG: hypothetical protein PHC88_14735 [Terrimicrobiaceae bacterium]|nr:hypothetical protein [Terrimicrobiaceae bacterium]